MKLAYRRLLYSVVALLFLTGAASAYWSFFVSSPSDFELGLKALAMKMHGAAATAILVLIGMLLTGHVRFAWRARRNRGNGSLFFSAFAVLTVTGYGLYYASGESLRAWTSWVHLASGLGAAVSLNPSRLAREKDEASSFSLKNALVRQRKSTPHQKRISSCAVGGDIASSASRPGSSGAREFLLWQKQN